MIPKPLGRKERKLGFLIPEVCIISSFNKSILAYTIEFDTVVVKSRSKKL